MPFFSQFRSFTFPRNCITFGCILKPLSRSQLFHPVVQNPFTGLKKCGLYDITQTCCAFVPLAAWTSKLLLKGILSKFFLDYDWFEGSQLRYKPHRPLASCGVFDTLGVTRLRLVAPRVYHIHHSFLGVYHTHKYTHTYVCVYAYVYVCMCMLVYMYVCMYVCR